MNSSYPNCTIYFVFQGVTLSIILTIVSVRSSPISNKIIREKLHTVDQIVYPSENVKNDSKANHQGFCPNRLNRTRLAANLDQNEVKCYEVGSQGPCPINMKFYAVPGKGDLGMCDCDQELNGIAYHDQSEQCNHLFSQETCEDGSWLELTSEGLACKPNPCISENVSISNMSETTVLFNGDCDTLNAKCNTTEGSLGQLGFDKMNEIQCLPVDINYSLSKSIPHLKCSPGSRWSAMTSSCRKAIKFNFS